MEQMRHHFVRLLILSTLSPTVYAQTPSLNLPKIEVMSSEKASLFQIPGAAQSMWNEDLKSRAPLSVQDSLKTVPGTHAVESEGFGFFPNIGLRGLNPRSSSRLLLLEDDIPIPLSLYLDPSTQYSPPLSRLRSISLLKGPSSLRQGPHTHAGLINMQSQDPPQSPGGKLSYWGGSRQTQYLTAQAGGTSENIAILGQWSQGQGLGNREHDNFNWGDGLLKVAFALGETQFISTKISYFQNLTSLSQRGLTQQEYDENPFQNPAQNDLFQLQRLAYDISHEWEIAPQTSIKTIFYTHQAETVSWQQNVDLSNLDLLTGNIGQNKKYQTVGFDSRLKTEYEWLSGTHTSEASLRYHQENLTFQDYLGSTAASRSGELQNHSTQKARAFAAQYTHKIFWGERWELTPALRFESVDSLRNNLLVNTVDSLSSGNTLTEVWLPSLASSFLLLEDLQIYAGLYENFSPPRIEYAVNSAGVSQQLSAERSRQVELGLRSLTSLFEWDGSFFVIDFQNEILPTANTSLNSSFSYINTGQTQHQGFEGQLKFLALDPFFFDLSWTYLFKAQLQGPQQLNNVNISGNRLPYTPEHLISLGATYRIEDFLTRVEYLYVSNQFTDRLNTVAGSANGRVGEISGFGVTNLNTEWRAMESLSVHFSVKNLTDQRYMASRTPTGIFPGLGRYLFIGLDLHL